MINYVISFLIDFFKWRNPIRNFSYSSLLFRIHIHKIYGSNSRFMLHNHPSFGLSYIEINEIKFTLYGRACIHVSLVYTTGKIFGVGFFQPFPTFFLLLCVTWKGKGECCCWGVMKIFHIARNISPTCLYIYLQAYIYM